MPPRRLPFYTDIKASYLLTDEQSRTAFLFTDTADNGSSYYAHSAFIMDDRDYRLNQTRLTVLQIQRTNLQTDETALLYSREGFAHAPQKEEGIKP